MSKSKTNQSHKERVNNFKLKQKVQRMSEQIEFPESPVAQQYPVWSSKAAIEMSGLEFEAIYNYMATQRNAVMAAESILQKNLQNGTIKYVYKDKEGKEVPDEEVAKYQAAISKFYEDQQKAQDQKGVPNLNSIVGPDGKPATSEPIESEIP